LLTEGIILFSSENSLNELKLLLNEISAVTNKVSMGNDVFLSLELKIVERKNIKKNNVSQEIQFL